MARPNIVNNFSQPTKKSSPSSSLSLHYDMVYTGVNAIALKVWTSKFFLTIKKKKIKKKKTQSLLL